MPSANSSTRFGRSDYESTGQSRRSSPSHHDRTRRTDSDGAGGSTTEWNAVAEVWAAIWSRTAGENFTFDRVAGTATHDIWIRYRADVKPDMRIRFGTRVFDILGAIDVEDRATWLKCPVEERDL